jgi:hypothetical protein
MQTEFQHKGLHGGLTLNVKGVFISEKTEERALETVSGLALIISSSTPTTGDMLWCNFRLLDPWVEGAEKLERIDYDAYKDSLNCSLLNFSFYVYHN